jgi:hypothetical protein
MDSKTIPMTRSGMAAIRCFLILWLSACAGQAVALEFEVALDPGIVQRPVTGRLFVLLSQKKDLEPRLGPNWFNPEPFFGLHVIDFQPGETRLIDEQADGFPGELSQLKPGRYRLQAVLDHSFDEQHHGKAPGNFYSDVAEADLDPRQSTPLRLRLNRVITAQPVRETRWLKEVVVRSELLSRFHGRDVLERCSVVLPKSYYDDPSRRYPVVYMIPGFSGSHRDASRYADGSPTAGDGEIEFIRVMLSGQCKWGHHVFANSATNGPRGDALVQELIPHIDRVYRTIASPTARFVNGHSSGGWSSLWLQVSYPDTFGGVWSSSPDPVSFHDYQQVNLYADPPLSLYLDERGQRRPIARNGRSVSLWYDSFGKMDDCIGRGGQLRSFEAVFSPLGEDGQPRKLWDRETGQIDPEVARAWQAYDIRLKLKREWPQLSSKLQGKLHVTVGSLDTFYLDGAVALLADTLKKLGSDADITILAGESHSSLLTQEFYRKMRRQMSDTFLRHHPHAAEGR